MSTDHNKQRGAALFVALVFLVIITLISITAMRSSTLELLMATNEQEQRRALDATQSASAVVSKTNLVLIGAPGQITCFGFNYDPANQSQLPNYPLDNPPVYPTCNRKENLAVGAGYDENTFVQSTMEGVGTCPPGMETSARGNTSLYTSGGGGSGGCVYFNLKTRHDAVDERGGRAETQEGFIRVGVGT